MRKYYTLQASDVRRPLLIAFGQAWPVVNFIGRVLPQDVGKRVYLVGDILQVENDDQRAKRLARAIA